MLEYEHRSCASRWYILTGAGPFAVLLILMPVSLTRSFDP